MNPSLACVGTIGIVSKTSRERISEEAVIIVCTKNWISSIFMLFIELLGDHLGQDCLCPPPHMWSVQNYPLSVLAERATPIPHSLTAQSHTKMRVVFLEAMDT